MTEHQEQHARLSPSSSKGWLNCAGRIVLESAYPNTSNEFSDDGTAMHTVAKMCLTEHWPASKAIGTKVPVHAPGELTRVVTFTDEMAELTQGYVDTVRFMGIGAPLVLIEHRVDFSEYVGVPGQFGTADAILLLPLDEGYELVVIDLKTGWVRVDPENNSQGMLYALGTYAELEMAYDIKRVRIGIYQPKHAGQDIRAVREWTCGVDELMAFAETAKAAALLVEDATREHGAIDPGAWERIYLHPNPNEEDCRFCRAMATCPAMARKVQDSLGVSAFSEITGPAADAGNLGGVDLAAAMAAAGAIEDWIKAVRAEVERRLLAGAAVEGFGLELGREGARKWTDVEAAETMLRKAFRLKIEDTYDMSLKSPTSVEKMTKGETPVVGLRQWNKLQALIGRAEAKPSVKPVSQIKKPYAPPAMSADGFIAIQPEDDLT